MNISLFFLMVLSCHTPPSGYNLINRITLEYPISSFIPIMISIGVYREDISCSRFFQTWQVSAKAK